MIDKFNGCLLGSVIGGALGAPVKFLTLNEIKKKYGKEGINDFADRENNQRGSYTEDMQMSLATALGCIEACRMLNNQRCFNIADIVQKKYIARLRSQDDSQQNRCLRNTCVSTLKSAEIETLENHIHNSKGCGGVMRAAPVGLAFPSDIAFKIGSEFAAITHGHPSGYLPAGFLAELVAHIIEGVALRDALDLCREQLVTYTGHEEILKKIEEAIHFSYGFEKAECAIARLGSGWIGEEALAIAIYCSLKFAYDFKLGVAAAVNHAGQSDSTGSITGAVLGALLGDEMIPMDWIVKLENSFSISQVAIEMFQIFKRGYRLVYERSPSE